MSLWLALGNKPDIFCPCHIQPTDYNINITTNNEVIMTSTYSPPFKFYNQAQSWANKQSFDDVWFLIYNYEAEVYQFVNDSRLHYLQHCWGLDMRIIETWE